MWSFNALPEQNSLLHRVQVAFFGLNPLWYILMWFFKLREDPYVFPQSLQANLIFWCTVRMCSFILFFSWKFTPHFGQRWPVAVLSWINAIWASKDAFFTYMLVHFGHWKSLLRSMEDCPYGAQAPSLRAPLAHQELRRRQECFCYNTFQQSCGSWSGRIRVFWLGLNSVNNNPNPTPA